MAGGTRSVSLARLQLVVVVGVILGFVEATVVSAMRARTSTPTSIGSSSTCSPGVLSSLVGNLVRNAVKYMGGRPVRRVVIRAADVGSLLRAAAPTIPGAGLGLATVKKLAQSHGGRAGCRSQPGQGSLFWFALPAAERGGHASDEHTGGEESRPPLQ